MAVAVIAAVLFLILGGDDDSSDSTTGTDDTTMSSTDSTSDTTETSTDTTVTGETTTETGDPTIGAQFTLETFETTLVATITDYHPVEPGQYDNVPNGAELVGVEMSLENTGNKTYDDSPGNGAKLITTAGVPLNPDFPVEGDCPAGDFSTSVTLQAGQTNQGCIAFQLREGQEGGEFEWTPNSGYADDSGRWVLPALTP